MATPTQELVAKLIEDEDFRRRVESAGSAEEARAVVQDAGFQPDREEAARLRDQLQGQGPAEISEDELNSILGGAGDTTTTTTTTGATAWVGASAAAAAA